MNTLQKVISPSVIILMVFFIVVIPMLPLLIAWRWNWLEAWAYAFTSIIGFVISRLLAARRHPDLLAERARFLQQPDAKTWDKFLAPLLGLGGALIVIVAGLDERFAWSPAYSLAIKCLSFAIFLAGYILGSYALIENRFFSGMVRIQTERNHQVVTTGPYQWIRHPGYAGAILSYLAIPFLLDSFWVILPVMLVVILLLIRTHLEDNTLQEELGGYQAYARQVTYRLLPRIW